MTVVLFLQAFFIAMVIIIFLEYMDGNPFMRELIYGTNGEGDIPKITEEGKQLVRKIGKTIYKITSRYEKENTLVEKIEKILERELKK